jgi:diketogulonate reductase-like aldo/keto reductase
MKTLQNTMTLNNSIKIPKIGFGTSPLKGDEAYQAVLSALKLGYRHIDTAAIYLNEKEVGQAIKDSNISRNELFITSKLPANIKTYEGALEAFKKTMEALNLDYLDLYLIHAPWPWEEKGSNHDQGNISAYQALEKLYKEKKIKSIGVSNFEPNHLENIITHCEIVPQVNQIKYHIGKTQKETVQYCQKHNILVEAYSPLGRGEVLNHPVIKDVASTYEVTPAQLCINYILENGILPLPRSKNATRMLENAEVDFKIKKDDMEILNQIIIE